MNTTLTEENVESFKILMEAKTRLKDMIEYKRFGKYRPEFVLRFKEDDIVSITVKCYALDSITRWTTLDKFTPEWARDTVKKIEEKGFLN